MTNAQLNELKARLIEQQIRRESAEADIAEFDRDERFDKERDRQVKTGRIRLLNIHTPIAGQATAAYLDALEHWERRDPGEPITITINSPGGSITDGLAIYDTIQRLRRKGHHVVTHGQGIVASMAGVLLQAGDERVMDARAKLMIHEGSTTFGKDTTMTVGEAEDYRAFGEMLRNDILEILSERSTLSKRQLANRWKRKDWWLRADEALALGFVDRVE